MLTAVARLELRFHAREFLTYVYGLVFVLLTAAFTSGAGIELVSGRGAVPRGAPWTLAHAMAGLTAFGQLMTAFIAATALLRDAATRMEPLLFATPLTARSYVSGKLAGAMLTMLLVYLAIPAGLLLGAAAPWAPPGAAPASLGAWLVPLAVLVIPNVVMATAAFFASGTFSRSFTTVAVTGLLLVGAWQLGLGLAGDPTTRLAGALVDPFGNAAIVATTAAWSESDRTARALPLAPYVLPNRLLWGAVGAGLIAVSFRRFRMTPYEPVSRTRRSRSTSLRARRSWPRATAAPMVAPSWSAAAIAWTRLTTRMLATEKGFVAIAVLGVLNAAANVIALDAPLPHEIATGLVVHTRIFFILVATIYAGELVWRDRDLRVRDLLDTTAARATAEVVGKAAALAVVTSGVVLVLAVVGAIVLAARGGDPGAIPALSIAGALLPGAMLLALAMVSLAVHALIDHKVRAHFALIGAWVVSVSVAEGGTRWSLGARFAASTDDAPTRIVALGLIAAAGALIAGAVWSRGTTGGWRVRTRQMVSPGGIAAIVAAGALLAVAAGL